MVQAEAEVMCRSAPEAPRLIAHGQEHARHVQRITAMLFQPQFALKGIKSVATIRKRKAPCWLLGRHQKHCHCAPSFFARMLGFRECLGATTGRAHYPERATLACNEARGERHVQLARVLRGEGASRPWNMAARVASGHNVHCDTVATRRSI